MKKRNNAHLLKILPIPLKRTGAYVLGCFEGYQVGSFLLLFLFANLEYTFTAQMPHIMALSYKCARECRRATKVSSV